MNDIEPVSHMGGAMVAAEQSRVIGEIQAAMTIAKRFPRDETAAITRIRIQCSRPGLAEIAEYEYPRGGQTVSGASIHLAKALKRCWGNIDSGWKVITQTNEQSEVLAWAWDMETNTREQIAFTVRHERKASGKVVPIEDPRDIYEHIANMAARRERSCILSVLPTDVVDDAREQCNQTLAGKSKEPIIDRVRKCVTMFGELGVQQDAIERRLGHSVAACTERDIAGLRKIFVAIRDGVSSVDDWFVRAEAKAEESEPVAEPPRKQRGKPAAITPDEAATIAAQEAEQAKEP